MSKIDDVTQFECDLYVEDARAKTLLIEVLARHAPPFVSRCQVIPYGAASVGQSLGIMANQRRFPRKSVVFIDGDQGDSIGCIRLFEDAPERMVFEDLHRISWGKLSERLGRQYAEVVDALNQAMLLNDHHDWIIQAASRLMLGGEILWQAMCAVWAENCLQADDAKKVTEAVSDVLTGVIIA